MARIAFLGLGAMGSRMALRLIGAGHALTVWNRSPGAVAPLVAAGAQAASTPRAAAEGAEFVFSMVRDDEAARQVWLDETDGAMTGLGAEALAIECSTLSVDGARSLSEAMGARGRRLLEAPVSGSLPAVEAGQLVFLPAGSQAALDRAAPVLAALGSVGALLGPVGQGALTKLLINSLLAEWIGLMQGQGLDVQPVLAAAAGTAAWSPIAGRLATSMLAGDFRAQFPVDLIAKDFRYALRLAGAPAQPVVAAVHKVFERACLAGLGAQNMTAVVQLFGPPRLEAKSAT